jgi:hypothetical protein
LQRDGLNRTRYYAKQKRSGQYRGCAAYSDFRELLDREKSVDAVVVCTTDHWHALVAVAAMKKSKHVLCQKPMTRTVYEARRMAEVARETGVATQVVVGNQASEATRLLCEWIWDGAIGPVRQVINWSSRPYWPQGVERPKETQPVPNGFDWDLWLGPSPERPFNHAYLPFVWRGWYDFGGGANFEFSGVVTEALLLGNVALRSGQRLLWDRANLNAVNVASAQQYIQPDYRQGWKL